MLPHRKSLPSDTRGDRIHTVSWAKVRTFQRPKKDYFMGDVGRYDLDHEEMLDRDFPTPYIPDDYAERASLDIEERAVLNAADRVHRPHFAVTASDIQEWSEATQTREIRKPSDLGGILEDLRIEYGGPPISCTTRPGGTVVVTRCGYRTWSSWSGWACYQNGPAPRPCPTCGSRYCECAWGAKPKATPRP